MAGGKSGHPLPGSREARHEEIPEDIAGRKGPGDDSPGVVPPDPEGVAPDGESYRYDDLGRGPGEADGD